MKSRIKIVVSLVMMAILALSLVGCGGTANIQRPPTTGDEVSVSGEVSATLNGNQIEVAGKTDIVSGGIYAITLDSAGGENLYKHVITKGEDEVTHNIPVDATWTGDVFVNIVFAPTYNGGQSEEIRAHYGEQFANMSGEDIVYTNEGNCFVVTSEKITLG